MRNENGFCNPKKLRHKYEKLRANALGNMNRASEFTVFLRNGMSTWMRALGEQNSVQREIYQQSSVASTDLDVCMSGEGLASILTDAILNAAGKV